VARLWRISAGVGFLVCTLASAPRPKPITDQNYRVFRNDGSPASLDDVIQAARRATVTFLGEDHEDAVAHFLEAEILKQVAGPDRALSLEMFDRDVQIVVDEYLDGLIQEKDLIESGRAWGNYKSDYRPLVEIAKENHMPVIAANAARRYVNLVSRKGQSALLALSAQAKQTLPALPYATASEAYKERFHRVMSEETGGGKALPSARSKKPPPRHGESDFALEAQSLWDAAMADSLARFLSQHPDKRVLQVNGSFHSEARMGILEHLERYRPGTAGVVVTMTPEKSFPAWDKDKMEGIGDFVIVTDPRVPHDKPKNK
jgi:uncharacterized iron-regulated protein